ncbi:MULTISPECIES: NACHT domain-containing protein [unclassified Providencia]|uniref:NACHT domain-containing protein n=1 Tax=unclassified Providencia TaxID=2633465 RepID=UPI00234AF865|nr:MULTISPECIES: NACHT domain-containing protein [unclassified Providencia]
MDPISAELVKIGVGVTTKLALESAIKSLSAKKWPFGKSLLEELLQDENYTEFLSKHVSRTIKIRTIHSAERDVYLNDIYHPLSIYETKEHDNDHGSLPVNDGFILDNNKVNNIIGFAGQGKSTILRKIFIEKIKNGRTLPFFIELHKAEKSGILKQVEMILLDCGLSVDEKKIRELVACGKVSLLLDGFDEIDPSKRKEVLGEILSLNKKYELQIITTTRPETDICHEPNIVNYRVKKLRKKDILSILKKLNTKNQSTDESFLTRIASTLKQNEDLVSVMNLPILVTLFHVCYPYLDRMPSNAVDFYSNLFMTLYLRHDKVKNYERFKSSNVSHVQAYSCFCTLSFISIYENALNFNEISLNKYIENAMKMNSLDIREHQPEKLASDFINITCLIQKDGYDKYVYLHKSIQEYHASEFIKNSSIDKKEHFYKLLLNDLSGERRFANIVDFLSSSDKENVIKYILLPLCESNGVDKWGNPNNIIIDSIFEEISSNSLITISGDIDDDTQLHQEIRVVSYRSVSDKYRWMTVFLSNEEKNSFRSPVYEFFSNLLFNDLTITDSITLQKCKENDIPIIGSTAFRKMIFNDSEEITALKLIKLSGNSIYVKDRMRNFIMSLHDKLYKKNKDKINNINDSINDFFNF